MKAAAGGAWSSIELVIKYVFIMIAFLAMLEFVNAVLSWFGGFVGYPEFSFQVNIRQLASIENTVELDISAEVLLLLNFVVLFKPKK